MKIAQLSDLHFTRLTFNPFRLCSKRILGHFNWIFKRKAKISENSLQKLPEFLKNLGVDLILLNGDFTTTSLNEEFQIAKEFTNKLPAPWIGVPGNHDFYTYRSQRLKSYYRFLSHPKVADHWCLSKQSIEAHQIANDCWLIALDTAVATNIFSSRGLFSEKLERNLKRLLTLIDQNAKIFLFTHYPFLQNNSKRRGLERADALEAILKKDPRIKAYLHGHTHQQIIADLQASNLPLILDPGCASNSDTGSFHLIHTQSNGVQIDLFGWDGKEWGQRKEQRILWTR